MVEELTETACLAQGRSWRVWPFPRPSCLPSEASFLWATSQLSLCLQNLAIPFYFACASQIFPEERKYCLFLREPERSQWKAEPVHGKERKQSLKKIVLKKKKNNKTTSLGLDTPLATGTANTAPQRGVKKRLCSAVSSEIACQQSAASRGDTRPRIPSPSPSPSGPPTCKALSSPELQHPSAALLLLPHELPWEHETNQAAWTESSSIKYNNNKKEMEKIDVFFMVIVWTHTSKYYLFSPTHLFILMCKVKSQEQYAYTTPTASILYVLKSSGEPDTARYRARCKLFEATGNAYFTGLVSEQAQTE